MERTRHIAFTMKHLLWCTLLLLFSMLLIGCKQKSKQPQYKPAPVTVSKVIEKQIPFYLEYVGNTKSIQTVDIRARIEGFLQTQNYTDGADVKKGDLLFIIDPRPYQAALTSAKATLAKSIANEKYYEAQVRRMTILLRDRAISKNEYDQNIAKLREARAQVNVDEANVRNAELNLSYCWMYSPMDGRASLGIVNPGNLVSATEQTKLTTIVKLDPMRVYFSPPASDLPAILKHLQKHPLKANITLGDDKTQLQYTGNVVFIDNQIGSTTSTILLYALVNNPNKTLLPGLFVKVKLLLDARTNAILIPQKAVMEGQGNLYVYVVTKDNKVEYRVIKTGTVYKQMQVITSGLTPGEVVITEGLQKVRPGMTVIPQYQNTTTQSSKQ